MRDHERLGEVLRDGERMGLRYQRHLAHPPEKVWRAITESEHLEHWLPCDIVGERRAGAELRLPFWPPMVAKYGIETPTLEGRIEVYDPPNVFEWIWDTDVLRFELVPDGQGGTRLTFTTWLGDTSVPAEKTAAGWHVCLLELREHLGGRRTPRLHEVDVTAWEKRYAAAIG